MGSNKRTVNPDSQYNKSQDLFAETYGPLANEGTEWTNEQIDQLLEAFLVRELRYLSARDCLRRVTGRSVESVQGIIWKLAVNYDRPSVRDYIPNPPFAGSRAGKVLTIRDQAMIEHATGQTGQKNKAFEPEYIARVLWRVPDDIECFYAMCKNKVQKSLTLKGPKTGEPLATTVNRVVSGSHKRLMSEIGL